jgi:outer membrane receptor for ferrienterochelin and colicins
MRGWVIVPVALAALRVAGQCPLRGAVLSDAGPVPYASVAVEGTRLGAAADAQGRYLISDAPCGTIRLRATAVGFGEASVAWPGGPQECVIRLQAKALELRDAVVTSSMREVARDESPVPVEVITPALFKRNPAPALLDAVGQVNGVRPQINCSVCNTGDIHINGMEGPYTMVLIDGMPIVSGLSTVYGLSGIPTALVERLEVVKGPGSALYGSEAMGGVINVITKDPALAPRVALEAMATAWQEHSLDLGLSARRGKLSALLGLNGYLYDAPRDDNGDGFTDLALQQRASLFGKVAAQRPERRAASLALRHVHEDRWGGQMQWAPRFAGGDSIYGEAIATRRWELIGQYHLPIRERVLAQLSYNSHAQRSWYGTVPFNADQRVLFAQLHWMRRAGAHDLLTGIAFRRTFYNDNTVATERAEAGRVSDWPQRKPLPGLFAQDEWRATDRTTVLLGYRMDHDRDHGLVHSPRMALKHAPSGRFTARASFGTGYRVVSVFTEDHAALTGARTVVIAEDLRPERSWNATLNAVRKWPGERRFFALDASLFHTRFGNRILPDYDSDPGLIIYRNLRGHGVAQGASLNAEARLGTAWRALMGATWLRAVTVQEGRSTEVLFAPAWSGTATVAWLHRSRWGIDLTGQWYGPMRLPVQPFDFRPERSPWHALLNIQARHSLGQRFECFGGVKNVLDFVPQHPLMRPHDPFDRHADDPVANPNGYTFDTAYQYAPLQGRRWFLGLRFTLG